MNRPEKKTSLKMLYETRQSATFKVQPRKYRSELDLTTTFGHNINMQSPVGYFQYLPWHAESKHPVK